MSGQNNKDENKKLPRDEAKVVKEEKKALGNIYAVAETVLRGGRDNPALFNGDEFKNIRNIIFEIARNPTKYPPPRDSWGDKRELLTKGVCDKLQQRQMDLLKNNEIYLQITHAESIEHRDKVGVNGSSNDIGTQKIWKFAAIDGDNKSLMFRIDSTLHVAAMTLTPGTIAKVTSFFPIYFNYNNPNDSRCAIVARKFEVTGKQDIPVDLPRNNNKAVNAKKIGRKRKAPPLKTNASSDTAEQVKPICDGKLCSRHGVAFDLCLAELIPPNSVPLEIVARDCVFATMSVEHMMNNHKRFLLYYYYATTIYQFHGAGNRIELPECIVFAIRELYPSNIIDMSNIND